MSDHDDSPGKLRDRLRYNVLFEGLSDEVFETLRSKMKERSYKAEEVIIRDRSDGNELYLLAAGRVKILKRTSDGTEYRLAVLHHGDIFGELELIDARPRSATVVAMDDCVVYTVEEKDFHELLAQSHSAALRMMQVLSIRLRSVTKHFLREIEHFHDFTSAEVSKLHWLVEASKKVNSTLDLDRVLSNVLEAAIKVVDAETGTLYLVDHEKKEIWSKVLKESRLVEVRLPLGKGIAGYVAATGDALNIPDAYMDPRFNPEYDRKSGFHTSSMLCLPMRNPDDKIIGVFQLMNKRSGVFSETDESFINALSIHGAIAIENARLHEQETMLNRVQEEIRLAAKIQQDLLPRTIPPLPGYELAGTTIPARNVGGDYFDFVSVSRHLMGICVADVSGKGLPASLLMANVQATLRGQILLAESPRLWMQRANRLLFGSTGMDKFVTLMAGMLDAERHEFVYSNGGHEHPVLVLADGTIRQLDAGGPPVAIMEDFEYGEERITIPPGATLIAFSDGITEAMNADGAQYGLEHLCELIRMKKELPTQTLLLALLADVRKHAAHHPQSDDMTIVIVRRNH